MVRSKSSGANWSVDAHDPHRQPRHAEQCGEHLTPAVHSEGQAIPTLQHARPTLQHESPTRQHESPTVQHESPTLLQHERPTLQQERPTLQHERPTLQHESPTLLQHERPTLQHESPTLLQHERHTLQHERPTLQHESPTLLQHESPTLQHERPTLLQHERPTLQRERPTLQHERPKLQHESPTLLQHERPTLLQHESPTLQHARPTAHNTPPDGGWGWVVVAAAMVIHFMFGFIIIGFAVLYIEFSAYFHTSKGMTGWIGSLFMASGSFMGVFNGALVQKHGCRKMASVGGMFLFAGLFLSVFAPNVIVLYLTYGLLGGYGNSLAYLSATVIVQRYFVRRRALAEGIAGCGTSIGGMLGGPLTGHLIGKYGWRGALLIKSSVCLHILISALVLRPVGKPVRPTEQQPVTHELQEIDVQLSDLDESRKRLSEDNNQHILECSQHNNIGENDNRSPRDKSCCTSSSIALDCSIIRSPLFLMFGISALAVNIFIYGTTPHIPLRATLDGIDVYRAAYFMTIMSVCSFTTRFLVGAIGSLKCVNVTLVYSIAISLGGLLQLFTSLVTDFPSYVAFSAMIGLTSGSILTLLPTSLSDVMGVERIAGSLGFLQVFIGVGRLIGTPMAGTYLGILGSIEVATNAITVLLSGILIENFGSRRVSMAGLVILSAGYLCSAYTTTYSTMVLSFGVLRGLGSGLICIPVHVIVQKYFDKRRALAAAIVATSPDIGAMAFGPLNRLFINSVGWRGGLILNAAITTQVLVLAALLREPRVAFHPIRLHTTTDSNGGTGSKNSMVETANMRQTSDSGEYAGQLSVDDLTANVKDTKMSLNKAIQPIVRLFSILSNWKFVLLVVGRGLVSYGNATLYKYSPLRAVFYGIGDYQAAFTVTAVGISSVVFSYITGTVITLRKNTIYFCFCFAITVGGIIVMVSSCAKNIYLLHVLFSCVAGAMLGTFDCTRATILTDLFGIDTLPQSLSWIGIGISTASFVAMPLGGLLVDVTGDFSATFLVAGAVQVFGGLCCTIAVVVSHKHRPLPTENSIY